MLLICVTAGIRLAGAFRTPAGAQSQHGREQQCWDGLLLSVVCTLAIAGHGSPVAGRSGHWPGEVGGEAGLNGRNLFHGSGKSSIRPIKSPCLTRCVFTERECTDAEIRCFCNSLLSCGDMFGGQCADPGDSLAAATASELWCQCSSNNRGTDGDFSGDCVWKSRSRATPAPHGSPVACLLGRGSGNRALGIRRATAGSGRGQLLSVGGGWFW